MSVINLPGKIITDSSTGEGSLGSILKVNGLSGGKMRACVASVAVSISLLVLYSKRYQRNNDFF